MTDHAQSPEPSHDDAHDFHGNFGLYATIGVALLILTGMSFVTPLMFGHLPGVMRTIMIAVSCCKAMLVILFFMHIKWEANWKYVLTFPAMFMAIFLTLMLVPDIALRGQHLSPERAKHMAVPAVEEKHEADDDGQHDH